MKTLSQRGEVMPSSPIRRLVPLADHAIAQGKHVFHLNIGQPDIHTPDSFMHPIKNMHMPVLAYGPSAGLTSFREKLVEYYARFDIHVEKEDIFVADAKAREIRFKGKSLELTAAEYDILRMLIQHKNGSVSREQLLYESEHIDDESSIKNIDVIISRIRHKIAKFDSENIYIKPIRGVGYLLTDRV